MTRSQAGMVRVRSHEEPTLASSSGTAMAPPLGGDCANPCDCLSFIFPIFRTPTKVCAI